MAPGYAEPGINRGTTQSHVATASMPLSDLGISKTQSSRWQKLAAIPDQDFEGNIFRECEIDVGCGRPGERQNPAVVTVWQRRR